MSSEVESSHTVSWVHEAMRKMTLESREECRSKAVSLKRFTPSDREKGFSATPLSMEDILAKLKASKYTDHHALNSLKQSLANGEVSAEKVLREADGSNHLHGIVNILTGSHCRQDAGLQLLACHVIANLAPLSEKCGLQMARSAGPYLVTLFTGSSNVSLKEASAVAIGNIGLAGYKVVKVLLNQEAAESLIASLSEDTDPKILAACFYALYHLLHVLYVVGKENLIRMPLRQDLLRKCITLQTTKAPCELFWLLFLFSCDASFHQMLTDSQAIHAALDTCTYEIFQKSDPRPLVKTVTPSIRLVANLCAGPSSETACLLTLRHPDLTAILMSLFGTNYLHLCKETLWMFANVVNCESVIVQEELIGLDILDKLECHTIQALQKLDPYAFLKI